MRFGTCNVRSLLRASSLTAAARELAIYILDVVCMQDVRCDKGGTVRMEDYNFFYEKGNQNHQFATGYFTPQIGMTVKRVELFSNRVSYIVLRGRLFNIIILNMYAPGEEKSDDAKFSFL